MRSLAILSILLFAALIVGPQSAAQNGKSTKMMKKKVPGAAKPECAQGAICFSGEVREGQEFRRRLNDSLDFVLSLPGGIDIVTKSARAGCDPQLWVANPPFMAHHDTEIDAAYDWTAEQEVETSPREFRFFTNCEDYLTLSALSQADLEKYGSKLESLAKGKGRLWITDSKVTHSHDSVSPGNGAIESMKFSVEITLP
jgi:hypothetical protein